jgi:succinate dehydrogenase/fumarate reductase cytochrome b subunit
MSVSDRLEQGAQAGANSWREGTKDVSWTGLLVAIALLAAGIAAILYVHAAVGIPLLVISLVVLYKSGFHSPAAGSAITDN